MSSGHGSGWGPPPAAPPPGQPGGYGPPPGGQGPSGWGPPPPGYPPAPFNPPPPHALHHAAAGADAGLNTAALVVGVLSIVGMVIGFVPCLGWINWINIPFGIVACILGIIGLTRPDPNKAGSIAGLVCGAIAIVLGFIRLVIGAGVL